LETGKLPDPDEPFPEKMKVAPLRVELQSRGVPIKKLGKKLKKAELVEELRKARPGSYPINFISEDQGMLEGVKELANLLDASDALALIHPQR
jgi:hypothetical protein